MAQIARSYKEGIRPPALDSAGGIQEGTVVIQTVVSPTSGDPQVIVPTGTSPWLTAPYGISELSGFLGGSGSAAGEAQVIKRQGLGRVKLTNGNATTRGQEFQADSGTLGNVIPRTAYSSSGWVLGTFEEALSSQSSDVLAEAYIQPVFKEIVRTIFGSSSATLGAVTKYLVPANQALAAADVVLAIVPFNGTLRNLIGIVTTAPAGTDTVIYTVRRNPLVAGAYTGWVSTAITCTITGTAVKAVDTADTLAVNAGDLIGIQVVSSAITAAGPSAQIDIT